MLATNAHSPPSSSRDISMKARRPIGWLAAPRTAATTAAGTAATAVVTAVSAAAAVLVTGDAAAAAVPAATSIENTAGGAAAAAAAAAAAVASALDRRRERVLFIDDSLAGAEEGPLCRGAPKCPAALAAAWACVLNALAATLSSALEPLTNPLGAVRLPGSAPPCKLMGTWLLLAALWTAAAALLLPLPALRLLSCWLLALLNRLPVAPWTGLTGAGSVVPVVPLPVAVALLPPVLPPLPLLLRCSDLLRHPGGTRKSSIAAAAG
jgi:hypothetical protein